MAQNPGADPQIPLTTFAGYVSYEDPVSLPAGASPACSDMVFQPGGTSSRPCLQKVFASPFGSFTITYGKSYVDLMGTIRNLYLDSAGNLWVENVTSSPGTYTLLTTTKPGSYAKSVTAFGREYIAISDGLHGADVPLQLKYDSSGNAQLDRFTSDGPGSSPSISNLAIPASALQAPSAGSPLTVVSITTSGFFAPGNYYTTITITVTSGALGLVAGGQIVISGNTNGLFNGPGPFLSTPNDTTVIAAFYSTTLQTGTGGSLQPTNNVTLGRTANIVTGNTDTPHGLKPGYQVQITNVTAETIGGSISSIVINNENSPGIATVVMSSDHGLVPGPDTNVSITGVVATTFGTTIASIVRAAQLVTVIMSAGTGISPGAVITIAGVTPTTFNGICTVANVTTTTNPGDTFTYFQADVDIAGTVGGGSTAALNWPVPDTAVPTFYNVIAAPTSTSFQIAVNYADGSWATGTVTFAWNGTFYVKTVPSATSFTYQQYGPDATTSSAGTVTPFGQAAPGQHLMTVFFIDRQGGITSYAPPVTFQANGGQYLSVTNIPIGPSPSTASRGIAFTGAEGAEFFYIPAPPQVNGQLVGTATQIDDNTTTAAVFDFGDPTLFRATGISTQGNNLANQIVIDGALGFGYYGSRLFPYGYRNVVSNLLNMGFNGGFLPNMATIPTGWIGGGAGALVAGHYGTGWRTSATPLTQSMYEDYLGDPIANPQDTYTFRAWLSAAGTVTATISSASTSFSTAITLTATGAGFLQGNLSTAMPSPIPPDMILGITGSGIVVDDMSLIYTQNPYVLGLIGSYANNPEGLDGVSGPIGPQNDTHQVLDLFIIRDNLYLLTRDPQGRLHQTSQGITEPADWVVNEVAANCGTVSAFSTTRSQADDASAAGGEEFSSWMSATGYRIFGGEDPEKISQEIQRPEGQTFPGAPVDLGDINEAAYLTVWSLNDPDQKVIYLGIPSVSATAPSIIYMLSYLGLDSAAAIIANPPIHKSLSGKLVATDLGRKWCPWQLAMNGAALMLRGVGNLQPVFFNGNGTTPNTGGAGQFGNVYLLNPALYTDADYGLVQPYYTTYAFPDRDTEVQNQLGGGMKTESYMQSVVSGIGYMQLLIFVNTLATLIVGGVQWSPRACGLTDYLMQLVPYGNLEWGCNQATGQRFFHRFASTPNAAGTTASPSTDNQFSLSVLVVSMRANARYRVRGVFP